MMIWAIYMYFDRLEAQLRHLEDIEHQKAWQRRLKDLFGLFGIKRLREDNGRLKARQRCFEAEEQRKKEEEISLNLQRLAPAVVHMSKKQRDKFQQRILEGNRPSGQKDQKLNQGKKNQRLNQRQKDQLKHMQEEQQQQETQRDQQLRQGQQDQQQQQDQQSKRRQRDHNQQQGYVPGSHDANCKGYGLFSFLISLLLLLPLASAQCSTCLGGRCHDTGQCIVGCVPGYMNQYCDQACPPNCLNNDCELSTTSATITCTDGCRPGYCGTKCTRPCPQGCVTCDRQCGSCNMTLCPERRYGEGCRSVCSSTHGKCDRETGECIKCRQGYYGDHCDLKCSTCFARERSLIYKCLPGCEVCSDEDPCPEGLFGKKCELECPATCGHSQETVGHPCNKATGECSAGCVSGYYGLTCNNTCSEHCLQRRCNKATGECSGGCTSGYHGLTCNYSCNEFCVDGICNQHDGVCTSGCVSGYTQKATSCEELQDTGVKDLLVTSKRLHILIISVAMSVLILSFAVLVHARSLIRSSKRSFLI